ncbi:MAG: hypothetical protein PUJ68_09950 [[Actinobacillus] rossii]|nr:hypothetical protein [[Actinobacillus] rossii]MDY5794085.1 hypothetical protein [[Actinobacillus] rossii]
MSKFISLTIEACDGDVVTTEQIIINSSEIKGFSKILGELHTTENGDGSMVWISRSLQLDLLNSLGAFNSDEQPRAWLEVQETPEQILAQING